MVKEKGEAICPLCAKENACNAQGSCWCFQETIPASLLALLVAHHVENCCVCQHCIAAFKSDPERFELTYFSR